MQSSSYQCMDTGASKQKKELSQALNFSMT